jgi:hypothetical protein
MSFRPTTSSQVDAVGMHDVSRAAIRQAVEDENVFAFVPPSTAEQARNARQGKPTHPVVALDSN